MLETEIKKLTAALEANTQALLALGSGCSCQPCPEPEPEPYPEPEPEPEKKPDPEPEKKPDPELDPEPEKKPEKKQGKKNEKPPLYTLAEVKAKLVEVQREVGRDEALGILFNVGDSKALSTVDPEKFAAIMNACTKALAEAGAK